jgi:hypothetical protein
MGSPTNSFFPTSSFLFAPLCNIYVRRVFLFIHLDAKSCFYSGQIILVVRLPTAAAAALEAAGLSFFMRFRPPSAFFARAGSDDVMILYSCGTLTGRLTALAD